MKRFFLIFILLLQSLNTFSSPGSDPLSQAKKIAIATNKLILVDFTAVWCGPCKRMESESWNKEDIMELSSLYVFIKIDVDMYRDIATNFGIKSIPNIFILDPNGEVIHQSTGYQTKEKLTSFLKKYAINLKYLQSSYIINFKKETASSLIRLAKKQQEFSILLNRPVKDEFLSLSRTYLKKAEKRLKKEKNSALTQEVELLYLHGYLISNNYDKVEKKLKKGFKEEKIDELNRSLYYFLNYMVNSKNNNKEKAKFYLDKLKEQNYSKVYLKEIKLLSPA
ncbi:MAG: hypothetical protein DSY82_08825 [Flavobacteriia bacterium]|nr:MAG: hypothetical protein DSY82_08825 [Flavobacteriia bacterium]